MVKLRKIAGLGIGAFCLSTAMLMSSCSKEDAAAPQPKIEIAKSDASMKTNVVVPFIAVTNGSFLGPNIFPMDWENIWGNYHPPLYAANGTSSYTHLCGRNATKWLIPLPQIPGAGAFVTTSSLHLPGEKFDENYSVIGEIQNLKVGKNYSVTFQISTANTLLSNYAKEAVVKITGDPHSTDPNEVMAFKKYDLNDAKNKWITKTIQFTAHKPRTFLEFYVEVNSALGITFGNIHVGPNALKQLN